MNTLFFDLDGTLLDTAADIVDCMNRAMRETGVVSDDFNGKFRIGPPLVEAVREALPHIRDDEIERFVVQFRQLYDSTDYPSTVPYEGVEETLAELNRRHVKMFIATNKRLVPTVRLIDKFRWNGLFEEILTFDMYPDRKTPKVEMLTGAMERFALPPDSCAMIGDAASDVRAGNEAGITSVAIPWGYDSLENLQNACPTFTVSKIEQIIPLLAPDRQ